MFWAAQIHPIPPSLFSPVFFLEGVGVPFSPETVHPMPYFSALSWLPGIILSSCGCCLMWYHFCQLWTLLFFLYLSRYHSVRYSEQQTCTKILGVEKRIVMQKKVQRKEWNINKRSPVIHPVFKLNFPVLKLLSPENLLLHSTLWPVLARVEKPKFCSFSKKNN